MDTEIVRGDYELSILWAPPGPMCRPPSSIALNLQFLPPQIMITRMAVASYSDECCVVLMTIIV